MFCLQQSSDIGCFTPRAGTFPGAFSKLRSGNAAGKLRSSRLADHVLQWPKPTLCVSGRTVQISVDHMMSYWQLLTVTSKRWSVFVNSSTIFFDFVDDWMVLDDGWMMVDGGVSGNGYVCFTILLDSECKRAIASVWWRRGPGFRRGSHSKLGRYRSRIPWWAKVAGSIHLSWCAFDSHVHRFFHIQYGGFPK